MKPKLSLDLSRAKAGEEEAWSAAGDEGRLLPVVPAAEGCAPLPGLVPPFVGSFPVGHHGRLVCLSQVCLCSGQPRELRAPRRGQRAQLGQHQDSRFHYRFYKEGKKMVSFLLPPLGNFRPSPCGSSSLRQRGQSPLSPHQGKAAPRCQPPSPASGPFRLPGGGFFSCLLSSAWRGQTELTREPPAAPGARRGDLGGSWAGRAPAASSRAGRAAQSVFGGLCVTVMLGAAGTARGCGVTCVCCRTGDTRCVCVRVAHTDTWV